MAAGCLAEIAPPPGVPTDVVPDVPADLFPDPRWTTLAAEALALVAIQGVKVVGHLEHRSHVTYARDPAGTLRGWADATGTWTVDGRRLASVRDAESLLGAGPPLASPPAAPTARRRFETPLASEASQDHP